MHNINILFTGLILNSCKRAGLRENLIYVGFRIRISVMLIRYVHINFYSDSAKCSSMSRVNLVHALVSN